MKKKLGTPKPSLAEINLAKTSGKTAAHIAARKKVARNYLENNGFSKDQIKDALGNSNGTIIGGVDLKGLGFDYSMKTKYTYISKGYYF